MNSLSASENTQLIAGFVLGAGGDVSAAGGGAGGGGGEDRAAAGLAIRKFF